MHTACIMNSQFGHQIWLQREIVRNKNSKSIFELNEIKRQQSGCSMLGHECMYNAKENWKDNFHSGQLYEKLEGNPSSAKNVGYTQKKLSFDWFS